VQSGLQTEEHPCLSRNARRRAELRDKRIRRAQQSEPTRACQRTSDPHAGFPLKEHRNDDHEKKGLEPRRKA